jgi:hypothetical protein
VNKTRAAMYLGWDPDTLVARMTSAGLDEDNSPHWTRGMLEFRCAKSRPTHEAPWHRVT